MKQDFENKDPEFYVYGVKHFNRLSGEEKRNYTEEQINRFRTEVKLFIMNNGSLYADTIIPIDGKNFKINSKGIAVMNTKDNTSKEKSHAVSIVGWDDDFSASNFPSELGVTKNGAYLALNSWGKDWGNNGYFWISYEDYFVETALSGVSAVNKGKIEISDVDINIKDEPDGTNIYNRAEHKLEITCNYNGMDVLDYFDIKYSNNINAGIAKVTITGTGVFEGTIEKEFEILPYDLESNLLNITYKHPRLITRYEKKIDDYIRGIEYTGEEIIPTILIGGMDGKGDITVEFSNNINIGTATSVITGDGKNIINGKTIEFNIIPIFIKNTTVIFGDNVLYDGTKKEPEVTIKYDNKVLVKGVDYEFEFEDNDDLTKIGSHSYKIEGIGIYGGEYFRENIDNPWLEFEIVPVLYDRYFIYNNCVMGIKAQTTIKEFKNNMVKANIDNFVFLDKNGKKIEGEYSVLKTGMRVCYMNQDEVLSINYIVVMGDLNGDGKLTLTDVVKASLRFNKIIILDKIFEKALDLNFDKEITLTDLVKINLANLKIVEL